ncbi:pathogenesis-related protein 1-like [Typha angustifolia]|uniref:pathogenesis-related protein 1-like n=1 Tax=Typha angustifolia TaxID=59011 RepID=UPI003C2ECC6B
MSLTWTHEIESSVSAPRLFKAALADWHNLGPKLAPHIIVSSSPVQGDGSAGSIREFKFTSAMPFSHIKERLDFVDHEKFECKQTVVEGGGIGVTIESISTHIKLEPNSKGGCVCKVVQTCKLLPGVKAEDEEAMTKETATSIIKTAEAYLLANPNAYL